MDTQETVNCYVKFLFIVKPCIATFIHYVKNHLRWTGVECCGFGLLECYVISRARRTIYAMLQLDNTVSGNCIALYSPLCVHNSILNYLLENNFPYKVVTTNVCIPRTNLGSRTHSGSLFVNVDVPIYLAR